MIETRLAGNRPVSPARRVGPRKPLAQIIAIALAAMASPSWAGPAGEQVVGGTAAVNRPDASSTVVHQTSQKAAIDWQNFDIGANESVRFDQPSSSSVALNRVVSQNPTEILGALTANGQVFVLNPNGVLFGRGAQVDVGGLVASTLDMKPDDFMAGHLQLGGADASGDVRNEGRIVADGGYVALAGPRVSNDGVVVADRVALAAGSKVDLALNGNRLVSISIDQGAVDALVDNRGLIRAEGGQVLLTAKGADHLIKSVVNNSGVIEASTLRNVGGRIRLEGDVVANSGALTANGSGDQNGGSIALVAKGDATLAAGSTVSAHGASGGEIHVQAEQGTLHAEGRIDAAGVAGDGGRVALLGERVALVNDAAVDVSGATGGGTALVGGDYRGGNAAVQNAERAYVASTATIEADAGAKGDGGKVVIWADGDTRYRGTISAKGGSGGGNGGLVEVSGKQQLEMLGHIDVAAPLGVGGKVLLDPQNIVLNTSTQSSPPSNANGTPDVAFADTPATGNYTIQIMDVVGYNELYLQATNNITLASALAMASGNRVRFEAGNAINLNAALTASGGVDLSATTITSTAAGTITSTGAANTGAGNISINATGAITLAGNLAASGGTSSGTNAGRNGGAISISGNGVALGTATVTASGTAGSGAAQAGGAGGSISITSTNGITGTGAMAASGGNGGTGVASGGAAGTITLSNSNAGNISVGALTARSGNAVTTGAGGAVGSIAVTNSAAGGSLGTGALTTTGGSNGHGGAVTVDSAGALTTGAIATGGGVAITGNAGRNAGAVTLTGSSVSTGSGTITASGSAGLGANQAGGNGANVQITSTGAIGTGAISTAGGAGITPLASGGSAGSILVANNSATTGAIVLGALTSSSGAAFGTGVGGTAGAVQITNLAAGQNLSTGAIAANGGTNSNGANVVLSSQGNVAVGGLINTNGGARGTGSTAAGTSAGAITISGVDRSVTGAITANGGAGLGTNQAGGNAGAVSITGSGTLTTSTIGSQTGAATGTGAGGTVGGIALTGSTVGTGALTTTGSLNSHGGVIEVDASGALTTGAIAAGGGTASSGTAGRDAGAVTLTGDSVSTGTGAITASGSAGAGTSQSGGNGANVSITALGINSGGITAGAINTAGGAGSNTLANGGSAGSISIINNSTTTGTISLGALTSNSGAAIGTGSGGVAGAVQVINQAAGQALATGAITANGGANSDGANVTLLSQGNATVAGLINTSGGARGTGSTASGTNAGAIAISGVDRSVTGAITANGGAGLGTNQAGGSAGVVSIIGTGSLTTGTIGAQTGAATGTGAGGTAGAIALTGSAITTTALTTAGGANGHGGVIALGSTGTLATGTIATGGGTANAGTSGRNAGDIALVADGAITGVGIITASGSAGLATGNQAGGNGAAVSIGAGGGVVTAAITASGGAAAGTSANGGNAGSISIANSGTGHIGSGALTAQTGAAIGTGAGGTAGFVAVGNTAAGGNLTTGAINTSGGTKGHGGNIGLTALGAVSMGSAGTVNAAGGTTITGNAGRNAGTVTLSGAGVSTGTGAITATGSAGIGTSQNGGHGANVQITSTGAITTGAINTAGGTGTTSLANGGNAGSIVVANNSTTTGAIALGALTSNSGAAFGTGIGGGTGAVQVTNLAVGQGLATGAINANGGTNGDGADVALASQGNVAVAGLINTSGGARGIGVTAAGTRAGAISISGVDRSVTGAITAIGGAGQGTNQAGGNAGAVSITGSGTLTTGAITSRNGAAIGTGAGGTAGAIALTGSAIGTGALNSSGSANGIGGNIAASTTSGNLSVGVLTTSGGAANTNTAGRNAGTIALDAAGQLTVTSIVASGSAGNGASRAGGAGGGATLEAGDVLTVGAISTNGGNAGASGNANGGSGGAIELDAGGATPVINLGGSITTAGGNRVGTGVAGAGGAFRAKDAVASSFNATINTAGGTTGGSGGSIHFDGALNEDATARTLTLTAGTGAIVLAGGTSTNALTALAATGGSIDLGSVRTKGTQTYTGSTTLHGGLSTTGTAGADTIVFNSPVTLTGNSSIATAGGSGDNIAINQTINGNFALALDAGALGTVATSAVIGGTTPLAAFSANGAAVIFGRSVTAGSIFARSSSGDIVLNTTGTVLRGTGIGDAVELVVAGTSGRFINNVGAGAIDASNSAGRFLVWSQNPANDTRGGLTCDFKQYAATYDVTPVADSHSNHNGFLYITAPVITVGLTGSAVKTYDGNDAATLTGANYSFSGAIDGDSVVLDGPTASNYVDKHAGANKAVTASGFAIDSATSGAATVYGYTLASDSATANIGTVNQRALTVSAIADSKTYNSSTSSNAAPTHAALQGSDTASFSQSFDDRHVGTGKTLTASGAVDDGNGGANYSYTFVDSNAGAITPAALTVTAQADSRGYNGTTASTVGPVVAGTLYDTVDTAATQQFADKNAGSNKTLTASGLVIDDGNGGNNYTIDYVANNSGTIARAALTVTAQSDSRGYNGTSVSTVGPVVSGTLYDTVDTAATQQFADKHAGSNKTLTASGLVIDDGNGGDNYSIDYVANNNGSIARAALTVTAQADSRGYNGTTASTVGPVVSGTLYDTVYTAATQQFTDKHAGNNKTLSASGLAIDDGNGGDNYSIDYIANNSGTISRAALTVTAQSDSRVYNGTTSSALAPVVSGTVYDTIASGATQSFDSKHAGSSKTLTASGLVLDDGNGGDNYAVTYVPSTTSSIGKAALTVGATSDSKVYDATTASSGLVAVAGLQGSDTVTGASQRFASKNVLGNNGSTLQVVGFVLNDGNGGGNYEVAVDTASGTITPASIDRVTGIAAGDKVYDTTRNAVLNTDAAVLQGVLGSDVLSVGFATGTFADKNAGNNKDVAITGITLAGADAGNYVLVDNTASTSADIQRRALTVVANDGTKIYGNADPLFGFAVGGSGLAGSETIADVFSGGLLRDAGENVAGGPYAIRQGTLAVDDNYSITAFTPGRLTIAPRPLFIKADDKAAFASGSLPVFTATYQGFAFADDPSSLAGSLVLTAPSNAMSAPGKYVIAPNGQTSSNYAITYTEGTLLVTAGRLTTVDFLLPGVKASPAGPLDITEPGLVAHQRKAAAACDATTGDGAGAGCAAGDDAKTELQANVGDDAQPARGLSL